MVKIIFIFVNYNIFIYFINFRTNQNEHKLNLLCHIIDQGYNKIIQFPFQRYSTQIEQMQQLRKINVQVRGINKDNLDQVVNVVQSAFNDNPIIINQIQTVQQLSNNTRKLFEKVLAYQNEVNKSRKNPIQFGAAYYKNGKIIATFLTCDMTYYLDMVDQNKSDDILLQPTKHVNRQNIKAGQDFYIGKVSILSQFRGDELLKLITVQRFQYMYSKGYGSFYTIATNKKTRTAALGFGCKQLDNSMYKLPNGKQLQMSIFTMKLTGKWGYVTQRPRL